MLAAIQTAAVLGIEAYTVTVEVDAAQGLPGWTMVGLPSGSVKEARERVGAALVNAGFALPPRRWTINLSPADIRKDGTAFDLPVALGVLVASGQLHPDEVQGLLCAGELGLEGYGAGKTGTTNNYLDAWFVGFDKNLTCGVWVGFDKPRPIMKGGYGGALALPIWVDIIEAAKRGS